MPFSPIPRLMSGIEQAGFFLFGNILSTPRRWKQNTVLSQCLQRVLTQSNHQLLRVAFQKAGCVRRGRQQYLFLERVRVRVSKNRYCCLPRRTCGGKRGQRRQQFVLK